LAAVATVTYLLRVRLALLIVACAGCGSPRSEPAAPTPTPDPVVVLDRGREPRHVLRYPASAGPRAASFTSRHHKPPPGTSLLVHETRSATGTFAIARGEARLVLDGHAFVHRIDGRSLEPPPVTDVPIDRMQYALSWVVPPKFPEEALGVGARWQVFETPFIWEIVEVAADRIVLRAGQTAQNLPSNECSQTLAVVGCVEWGAQRSSAIAIATTLDLRDFILDATIEQNEIVREAGVPDRSTSSKTTLAIR
jgi:hypothetical protein